MTRRAHRQREYGPGRILVRLRHERTAIRDEEILAVPGLAVRVERAGAAEAAHANATDLVNDRSTGRNAITLFARRHRRLHHCTHLLQQSAEGLLHVLDLRVLVVGPL